MPKIASRNCFTISSSFGSTVMEGDLALGKQGAGASLTFTIEQASPSIRTVYVQIIPVSGQTADFWDSFFSNKIGGEPADKFALSRFVSVEPSGEFTVSLTADTVGEPDETFEIRVYEDMMDQYRGIPPLVTGSFTVLNDDMTGSRFDDVIAGRGGSDAMFGLAGNDTLNGGAGNDTLDGGEGNDRLNGGLGIDRMLGGKGNDTFIVDNTKDVVIEHADQGIDLVLSSVSHTLSANVENLILTGNIGLSGTGNASGNLITGNSGSNTLSGLGGNDKIDGGAGNDRIDGGQGDDILIGGAGNDQLIGGRGVDRLTGGIGADLLMGGAGADVFIFNKTTDSIVASGGRDTISDFSRAQGDRIDLRGIDADISRSGDQAFTFIGNAGFTGRAGDLSVRTGANGVTISGDVNGDKIADFAILVSNQATLGAESFLL
ncbi:MAG: hypothetical protein DI498_07460 [Paracoccus denitrificans]|nr:MAG: hypothetical protein DI498_07460 [Paracoccus denitrificans]PZO84630.1 MAG: hypothetical protein DI633_07460 [Paracoccus denitrificans]